MTEQELVDALQIDPKTHPVILQEYEWNLLMEMQEKGKLHLHKWVYRGARPKGDVRVLHNTQDGGISDEALDNGRYCKTCGKVQFLPEGKVKGDERWTQLDMIALGLK